MRVSIRGADPRDLELDATLISMRLWGLFQSAVRILVIWNTEAFVGTHVYRFVSIRGADPRDLEPPRGGPTW